MTNIVGDVLEQQVGVTIATVAALQAEVARAQAAEAALQATIQSMLTTFASSQTITSLSMTGNRNTILLASVF